MKLVAAAALAALAVTTGARAASRPQFVALPSPLAQLSPAPPLAGGATASSEGFRHHVDAATLVDVSLDPDGSPFAVRATQRLDVGVKGDYFFTIGAPVLDVVAAPGSAGTPGLRSASILWAGFNPGRRKLIGRATLDPAVAAPSLPLRIEAAAGRVTLVNATAVTADSFTADALAPPLRRYLAQLDREAALGAPPTSGGVFVTSKPVQTSVRVVVPLRVTGTVGARRVNELLLGRSSFAPSGAVRLRVTAENPARLLGDPVAGLSGRRLLERVTRAALTLARVRQYRTFLGNPDPAGPSRTTYVYRTASRPAPPPVAIARVDRRNWTLTLAIAAGLVLAAAAALVAWSRS
ncbi:MAG: hypothetical protein QOH95_1065 [Gaiellaceae bacterium]|nr:hypothetical protein [Gaiellaceae bacterium]